MGIKVIPGSTALSISIGEDKWKLSRESGGEPPTSFAATGILLHLRFSVVRGS